MLQRFSYKKPATLQEAVAAAARPGARILGGGTDLLGCLRDGVFNADCVVSLTALRELKGITPRTGGGLRIGATTTLSDVAANKQVQDSYRALAEAAAAVSSPPLRNQGTLGGNLCQRPRCWYFRGDFHCRRKGGDMCFAEAGDNTFHAIFGADRCFMVHPSDTASALVALGARVSIAGPAGRRTIPLESFFVLPAVSIVKENVLKPGEIVTEILLDAPPPGLRSTYRKVRERGAFDFATVGAAVALTMTDGKVAGARVVLSGVAPKPWRCPDAEKALIGKALDDSAAEACGAAAVQKASALERNDYKIAMARGVVEETLLGLAKA